MEKKGFTLVELLAVIVILAVILIIAIPQIMNTIKTSRLKTMEGSAKLIASNAEKYYLAHKAASEDYAATSIPCADVAKLSEDYSSCSIIYDANGTVTVKLEGAAESKFEGLSCSGTKDEMQCKSLLPGYTDAVTFLTNLCMNIDGCSTENANSSLVKTNEVELRYRGSDPNNYVTFNNEVAGWRIVGLFNVDGEQRIKLVKKNSIGTYSWDSSVSTINSGYGINEWNQSDLKILLNDYYYNGVNNGTCYNGANNASKTCTFAGLTTEAKKLIADATWYLGGGTTTSITPQAQYAIERGNSHVINPSDGVERKDVWTGKIGLIYLSDWGYASGSSSCKSYLISGCTSNWLGYGWTISPSSSDASKAVIAYGDGTSRYNGGNIQSNIKPALYLIPGVQIKGSGTTSDPYVFAE